MTPIGTIWVYLESTPLLGLAITLIAWQAAVWISGALGDRPLLNPVLIAIVLLVAVLLVTRTTYSAYFQGAQYVHFLLGPATVALAVPMHAAWRQIRRSSRAIVPAILAGSVVSAVSVMLIGQALGGSPQMVLSLAPKSVTSPIAMGVAEQIGGNPSLAAVFVLLTGLASVVLGPPLWRLLRITDWRARGLAAGTAGHGLATARVLMLNETAGAFGGLAIGLNGIVTAVLVPPLARWLLN
ncbi:MAG: LrgB family protein [Gemmatimonadaceae bacterium]|nr:LrgB family protein [Acetobacteraceae bacterium]